MVKIWFGSFAVPFVCSFFSKLTSRSVIDTSGRGHVRVFPIVATYVSSVSAGSEFKIFGVKAAAAAEVHKAAWSTQGKTRGRTGLIRAALLSQGPQSLASRLIARREGREA
jgi:hypothetical protein